MNPRSGDRTADLLIIRVIGVRHYREMAFGDARSLLILDTEFAGISPDIELLSLALTSVDGAHEFYGERNDVPAERCSRIVREEVLSLMTAKPPVSGDLLHLRARLRAFLEELPDTAIMASDSLYDLSLLSKVLGRPWPERLSGLRFDLAKWTAIPVFADAQARYHEAGHPYHHAQNDVRGLRAGYRAWLKNPS